MEWKDPKTDEPELERHCIAVMSDATLRTFYGADILESDNWKFNDGEFEWQELLEPFESVPLRPYILYWAYIDFSKLPKCRYESRVPAAPSKQFIVGETQKVSEVRGDSGYISHLRTQKAARDQMKEWRKIQRSSTNDAACED